MCVISKQTNNKKKSIFLSIKKNYLNPLLTITIKKEKKIMDKIGSDLCVSKFGWSEKKRNSWWFKFNEKKIDIHSSIEYISNKFAFSMDQKFFAWNLQFWIQFFLFIYSIWWWWSRMINVNNWIDNSNPEKKLKKKRVCHLRIHLFSPKKKKKIYKEIRKRKVPILWIMLFGLVWFVAWWLSIFFSGIGG